MWNIWKGAQEADPVIILYGVLIFSWIEFVWEAYLSFRQRRIYRKHTTPPVELKGIVDDETFEKVKFKDFREPTIKGQLIVCRICINR